MKILNDVLLIVVVLIAGTSGFNDMQRHLGYNLTTSLSDWVSWIANSNNKICRWPETSSTSYCWDSWDTSSVCGGNPSIECTTDTGISGNARYILWPTDSSIWNDQYEQMYPSSSTKTFSSSNFGSSYAWKYHLDTDSPYISGYRITATSVSNANLTIYVEETTGSYTFNNTLSSSGNTFVSIGSYNDVFIVATTFSSSAYVSFNVTATTSHPFNYYSSNSSYLSVLQTQAGLPVEVIVPMVMFLTFWCCRMSSNFLNLKMIETKRDAKRDAKRTNWSSKQYNCWC